MIKNIFFLLVLGLILAGCNEQKETKKTAPAAMKCGVGKCGANLVDGSGVLAKKKKNIISQMREDDTRRECVLKAKTTKAVYDCIRSPETGKLTK
ncbi:hypothetical protein [Sulfurimonas microaerophilic]|uniref:hypothetical protein n=1 Tax=Sulfurimonas microaerophilic TaxID=3058392 RepID=UPI0027145349|nr:hypothetical protein [Sulfurimonas sp. hsl 1-7]